MIYLTEKPHPPGGDRTPKKSEVTPADAVSITSPNMENRHF
jgi:hypothetical protein